MTIPSTDMFTNNITNIDGTKTPRPDIKSKANCPYKSCKHSECKVPWHYPCQLTKNGTKQFVSKLKPIVTMIGAGEVIIGVTLLVIILLHSKSYDEFYGTIESKVISLSVLYGLVVLIVTGLMLSIALLFNIRRMLWVYILLSSILSVYIFTLAMIKIHFAFLVMETDTNEMKFYKTKYILNNGCAFGILTLLGSVVHFVENVTIFSYHNLKYVHPVLFDIS